MRYLIPLIVVALLTTAASAQYGYNYGNGYRTDYAKIQWWNRYGQPRAYAVGPGVRNHVTGQWRAGNSVFTWSQSTNPYRGWAVPVYPVRPPAICYPSYPTFGYGR
jgi:hypothetical protein